MVIILVGRILQKAILYTLLTISCNGDFVSMTRSSNVKFAAGSSENLDLDLIVYTEHDKIAEIDIARKVKRY